MIPRPDSIESFMAIFKMGFNSEGAAGMQAVMQYKFSGSVVGECYFSN